MRISDIATSHFWKLALVLGFALVALAGLPYTATPYVIGIVIGYILGQGLIFVMIRFYHFLSRLWPDKEEGYPELAPWQLHIKEVEGGYLWAYNTFVEDDEKDVRWLLERLGDRKSLRDLEQEEQDMAKIDKALPYLDHKYYRCRFCGDYHTNDTTCEEAVQQVFFAQHVSGEQVSVKREGGFEVWAKLQRYGDKVEEIDPRNPYVWSVSEE
jgi:hypothetical protein